MIDAGDRLRIRGRDAVSGEWVERWVADGVFVEGEVAGAAELSGFLLPGLVDAHCHVGYSSSGVGDLESAIEQATTNLRAGVLAIRDCGSPVDTRPLVGRRDLPVLVRAGRHIAQPKRYIRGLGVDIAAEQLVDEVRTQLDYGGGWIKLIGDWIDRDLGDLAPLWPQDLLVEAIAVAHEGGARVTAHVFGEDALPGLLSAGIDCIEHGTGLTADTIEQMVAGGVHLVPTLINIENFPSFADAATRFPAYAKHMRDLYDRRAETFTDAIDAGIPLHGGTDAGGYIEHGRIVDEVLAMIDLGMPARQVLHQVSPGARDWLGLPGGAIGDPADLVIYPDDPAVSPEVLRHPVAVLRAGRVVAGSLAG